MKEFTLEFISINNGEYSLLKCPRCEAATPVKVTRHTQIKHLPLYCLNCNRTTEIAYSYEMERCEEEI